MGNNLMLFMTNKNIPQTKMLMENIFYLKFISLILSINPFLFCTILILLLLEFEYKPKKVFDLIIFFSCSVLVLIRSCT